MDRIVRGNAMAYLPVHAPIGKKDYKTSATSFQIPRQNSLGKA
jgi:hypothetical protein